MLLLQDEADAHRQPDQDADQQVGQDDGHHRHRERDELVPPLVPHLLHQRRAGQLDPRDQQDRRQAGQRDQVQPRRQERDADQQQDAVDDRRELRPARRR